MKTTETIKIKREYTTSDLCLAVVLRMNGGRIKKITPLDQRRFMFHFEDKDGLKEVINDYFSMSMQDHPYKRFYNEMREIKNMIYNFRLIDDSR